MTSRSHRQTFFLSFLLFFAAAAAWAMATPIAASPDEPAHILRAAAVAHGQLLPDGHDEDGRGYFTVPASLDGARGWEDCFAHEATEGAACQEHIPTVAGLGRESTTASAYNPVYYAIVGWPSLLTDDPYAMVYSMRLLTAAVTSALLASAFYFLSTILRRGRASLVMAAAATPMVFFLGGSVNPNAWEIVGSMALLTAVLSLGLRTDGGTRTWPALTTVAVAGFTVANLRGVSPLWVAVLGLLGLWAISGERLKDLAKRPGMWISLGVVALGFVAAVAWGAVAGAFALEGEFDNKDWSPLRVVDFMLRRTIFEQAYVGLFGWTDTAAPLIAVVILGGLGVATVAAAFWLGRGKLLAVTATSLVIWLAAPALIQLWYVRSAGMIWQGRYTLVMYTAMIILSAVAIEAATRDVSLPHRRRIGWIVGTLATFAHGYTFAFTAMRYAEGTDATVIGAYISPSWAPPGGALVWLLLTCGACAVFTWSALARHDETSTSTPLTRRQPTS